MFIVKVYQPIVYPLAVILLLAISSQSANVEDVPEYLIRKLRQTKVEIAKDFMQRDTESVASPPYNVEWVNLWSQRLHSERTLMVSTFNKMCILEGNRLISVAVQPATNKTSSALQQVALIRQERLVKFAKSILWKSKLYLLVCHEDDKSCGLYTGSNDFHLRHRQIIKDKGWPMDATFFTRANRLYLVVAQNTDQFPVASVIYHWTGTYMDVIYRIMTVGAVSVTAFNYKFSTIIIFGQNERRQPDISSEVYEFDENGIDLIQYLPTNSPISIHYYTHKGEIFLLVVNEFEASTVYWWDGDEFLHWIDLPNIIAPSLVNVAHFNGDTLFFVSYESYVTLYKVLSSEYLRLNLLELKNGEMVVDMGLWSDGQATLTLLLVTVDKTNLYRIEPWELRIKKIPKNESTKDTKDAIERCLSELEIRLSERVTAMESLIRHTWPTLHPSSKSINIGTLNGGNKLVLRSGSITKVDVSASAGILLAGEIESLAGSSGGRTLVNSILEESRKSMKIHGANRLVGNVTIQENAIFEGLHINSIHTEFLNGRLIDLANSVISSTRAQNFSNVQLTGRHITVRELQIDRLCGVPFDYWLKNVNERSDNIFLKNKSLEIIDDTVLLRTGRISFNQLNLQTINGVKLDSFFSDLFIPGQRQFIKGNVVQGQSKAISVGDLVVQQLNGIAQEDLMTLHTNQSLDKKVFVKTMQIRNLVATKINGIAVSESAMVSKKNHIKGEVTIARMRILDELAIENPSKFPKFRPVQVYDEVTIVGNVRAENLVLEPYTNFVIPTKNGLAFEQSNIDTVLDSYWTKSSSQTIKNKVSLDAGLTVNELRLDYLNNLNVSEDVMLTTVREINAEFASLEFTNFAASGWLVEETVDPAAAIPLWTSSVDSLAINQELQIQLFGAQYLEIETFNGIPVVEIMNKNLAVPGPYKYPANSVQRFNSITVNERLVAEDLALEFVNGKHERALQDFLQSDLDYQLPYLRTEKLTLQSVKFESETEAPSELQQFTEYLQNFTDSSRSPSTNEISLIVDGDLLIEKNLQVDVINHMSTETYLDDLVSKDFAVSSNDQLIIDTLIVHGNLTVNILQGSLTQSLLESTLSKSRVQNLSNSRFSCHKITVDDLNAERVNKRYTKELVYTDSDIKFDGDVTFTNLKLSLDEDTQTKSLNGYPLNTLYKRLGEIPLRQVNDLTVRGNVAWKSLGHSSSGNKVRLGPLDTIIKSALVKSSEPTARAPQVISGETRINSRTEGSPGVFVRRMSYKHQDRPNPGNTSFEDAVRLQGIDMKKIIMDAVLDDTSSNEPVLIANKKSFAEDLTASQLNVDGEIDIGSLNKWNVKNLNASVVRKESLSSLIDEQKSSRSFNARAFRQDGGQQDNTMIFREDIIIKKLVIQTINGGSSSTPLIHGVPISAIVFGTSSSLDQYLPNNTYLKHLEVKGNAFVKTLDNVDLDEFANDRVTIHSNHQVHANLQFNGRVQVSQGATVRTINGIAPSDFVVSNSHEDQRIVGEKIFHDDIEIRGKTYAPSIAGINFKEEYDNSVLNYQNAEIFGDLIFQADIERPIASASSKTHWQLDPAGGGFVNEMKLRSLLSDRDAEEEIIMQGIKSNESRLELSIARASNASSQLPEIFYYFDSADDLKIDVANVERVKVMKIEDLTVLNMYASEVGSYCGLENDCPCRRQYVAEMSSSDCDSRQVEGPRIVYNFHEPNGAFGVTVTTTSVSSSRRCSTPGDKASSEFTTISWMKQRPDNHLGANFTKNAHKIYGYLSDVEVFTQNDLVFIVLAIYYDPIKQSHETNSLIYLLDLTTNEINLAHGIPTSHASGVRVFKIPSKGAHVLLTSSGSGERGQSSESLLYRFEPSTAKFELLRTFTTGGSSHGKSVSQPKDEFLFLDDAATNTIHVYVYNVKWDNFYFYQSLYHDSMAPVTAIETLYAGEFRRSQVYVIVTTKHDQFFVYEYMFFSKFQIIAQKKVKGILTMVPFDVSNRRYVFAGTETNSTILRVIEQGQH